jgi:hypothetical protein
MIQKTPERQYRPAGTDAAAEITAKDAIIMQTKVFGIGFHKTGGFGTYDSDFSRNVYQTAWQLTEQYDAFQDFPWPLLYKDLDRRYPGSKFVLTIRPTDQWITSVVRHFGTTASPVAQWVYGPRGPKGNEAHYIALYERHNKEVREFFRDRPDDLLIMDFTRGDGWEKLCSFLNKEIPGVQFPHLHKAKDRERKKSFWYRLYATWRRQVARLWGG